MLLLYAYLKASGSLPQAGAVVKHVFLSMHASFDIFVDKYTSF